MPFDTFTGSTVQPSDVSYRAVALSVDVTLVWPSTSQTSSDVVARIMNVTPAGAGLSITMPDATQRSTGQDALIRNLGASMFTIKANDGSTIDTVAAGEAKYIYLVVNTTPAGSWSVVTFGTGTSSADAAALAGMGLLAVGSTLNQKHDVAEIVNNLAISTSDRAKTYVWTSGSYTLTLPTAASVGSNFFFIAKNAGSGTISTAISGADTVDTSALAPGESAIFYSNGANPGAWYSVGQGRNVAFSFTQLVKSVAGGVDVTLSSAEAANKVMSFTGVLTANINVIVPNTVSVYYVYNNTSGAFTLTVKTAAGSGIGVAQGTRDILVCDATNVLQAMSNTVVSTIFNVGSESLPSITFLGDTDSGFYDKAANQPAVTAGGTDAMRWNTVASAVNAIDVFPAVTTAAPYLVPFGGDANVSLGLRPLGTGTGIILQDASGTAVVTTAAASVTFAQPILFPDNTKDIGASGATRPRTGYFGTSIFAPLIGSNAASQLSFTTTGGEQFRVAHIASAVNYVQVQGAATLSGPGIAAQGTDTDIQLSISSKGNASIAFTSDTFGATQFRIDRIAGSTRFITVSGSNGGNPTLNVTAGSLAITPATVLASTLSVGSSLTVGGATILQNSQSAPYTTVAADANKHLLHPTADNNPRTFTIDSNANVPYTIGTCITFVNEINTLTIAITADTMTLAGAGTTGSRTLAAKGMATAMKIGTTSWIISGTGLS